MTDLTKEELRVLLATRAGPDDEPLRQKLRLMLAERAGQRDFGEQVFQWMLPLSAKREWIPVRGKKAGQPQTMTIHYVPSLNEYARLNPWQAKRLRAGLDVLLMKELAHWPKAIQRDEPRARGVRVTRYSSRELDETTVDCAGGKAPIDRLVRARILRGDAPKDLVREALWKKVAPSKGCLVIDVFELV